MKRWMIASGIAGVALVAVVGTAVAAGPNEAGDRTRLRDTDGISQVLGLSHDEVMALREEGLSLAQIAERQGVDPEALVTRLTERAQERLTERVENGALQPEEAAQLQARIEEQVRAQIADPAAGGLGGILGAGHGQGAGNGSGAANAAGPRNGFGAQSGAEAAPYGTGDCDGTGPSGASS